MSKSLKKLVWTQVNNKVQDQICVKVYEVENQIWYQVYGQVYRKVGQVYRKVWLEVSGKVLHKVKDNE
jgi:hypothetical protein